VQTADQRKQSRAEHGNHGGGGEEHRKKREEEQSHRAAKEGGREDIPASHAEQSWLWRMERESQSRVADGAESWSRAAVADGVERGRAESRGVARAGGLARMGSAHAGQSLRWHRRRHRI
jgi:hypothetical protein